MTNKILLNILILLIFSLTVSDNKNILSEKRNLQRFKNERISNLEKKRSCLLNGHVHKPYTTIRRGCNSCICFFGRFVCSKRQCSIKTKSTKRLIGNSFCRYQRRKIQIGVRFITSNGCRSCGCQRNRQISCYSTNIGSCKLWNKKPLERFSCQFGQHTISDGKYFAIDSCGNRCGCESSQLTCTSIVCEKEPKYKKIRVVRAKCPNNGPQLILREEDYYRYKTIMDDSCNSCQCVQKNDNCLSQIVGVDECENIYSTSSYVLQCTRLNCAERSCLVMGKLVLSGSTCSFPSNGHDSYKCYDGMILC
ncbi:hypothetical protein SNEBB_004999 [Seison nebaliae]|nr:hypothetical protein SNEBB_004999 [Seison nebaliae]